MEHWNLLDQRDPYIIGLLVADGYVVAKDFSGGIDMCDERMVALVAGRLGAPYHMRTRKKGHKDTWRDQYIAQWSSGQPNGYRARKPQPAWLELVDTGLMRTRKKYNGTNTELLSSWPRSARMAFHAGFIEGDGHVRCSQYGRQVTIENHSSLTAYHELFRADTGATGRINNRGHIVSTICARENRQKFLDEVVGLVVLSTKLQTLTECLR